MTRYIVYLSYIGTRYHGIQNQGAAPLPTIHKALQGCLKNVDCFIFPRSRTDSGVHAVSSAVNITIHNPVQVKDEKILRYEMNSKLKQKNEDIRVLKVQKVNMFPKVLNRHYVYRLCIMKSMNIYGKVKDVHLTSIFQHDYHIVYPDFDMDLFLEAAELLSGRQNRKHFTVAKGLRSIINDYYRDISITIARGHPNILCYQPSIMETAEFWDIHVKSRSYVYKQIRKMVALMIYYAQKETTFTELKTKLMDQTNFSHFSDLKVAPAKPLYLLNVELEKEPEPIFCTDTELAYIRLSGIIWKLKTSVRHFASRDIRFKKNPSEALVKDYLNSIHTSTEEIPQEM